jgi:hypothetical protein
MRNRMPLLLAVGALGLLLAAGFSPLSPGRVPSTTTSNELVPDQGSFWVGVRMNPAGMVTFSCAIFAGVAGRNP